MYQVGKNDGSVASKRYFTCTDKHGVFVPPHKLEPVHAKQEDLAVGRHVVVLGSRRMGVVQYVGDTGTAHQKKALSYLNRIRLWGVGWSGSQRTKCVLLDVFQ